METPHNPFKQALKDGKQQYGYWLGLCSPLSAELCAYAGYDWLLIDAEHAPNDINTVLAQLQAIAATPSHAVVRLVNDDPAIIKQYLDIGVQSLLIPMIETAQQAKNTVRATQYPPRGIRGVGTALARAARWNMVDNYLKDANDELCLIIQIESVKGIENLDGILAVEGIDGIFIGPADLAATMGHLGNPTHPDVQVIIKRAIKKISASNKAVGTLAVGKEVAQAYEEAGVQFIAIGVDTLSLAYAARQILADCHNLKDKVLRSAY